MRHDMLRGQVQMQRVAKGPAGQRELARRKKDQGKKGGARGK